MSLDVAIADVRAEDFQALLLLWLHADKLTA